MNPKPHSSTWQFWIDRGGTFTDIVARRRARPRRFERCCQRLAATALNRAMNHIL